MTCALQHELDRLARQYDREVDEALKRARIKYIVPFCDKHGLRFNSGMGSWSFHDSEGRYDGDYGCVKIPKRVREVLECDLVYRQDAGSMMTEYTTKTYRSAR